MALDLVFCHVMLKLAKYQSHVVDSKERFILFELLLVCDAFLHRQAIQSDNYCARENNTLNVMNSKQFSSYMGVGGWVGGDCLLVLRGNEPARPSNWWCPIQSPKSFSFNHIPQLSQPYRSDRKVG